MLDTNQILREVLNMRKDIKESRVKPDSEKLKLKYSYLNLNVPTLFRMVYADSCDYMHMLNHFITNLNKMNRKEITLEEANIEIGDKVAEKCFPENLYKETKK